MQSQPVIITVLGEIVFDKIEKDVANFNSVRDNFLSFCYRVNFYPTGTNVVDTEGAAIRTFEKPYIYATDKKHW